MHRLSKFWVSAYLLDVKYRFISSIFSTGSTLIFSLKIRLLGVYDFDFSWELVFRAADSSPKPSNTLRAKVSIVSHMSSWPLQVVIWISPDLLSKRQMTWVIGWLTLPPFIFQCRSFSRLLSWRCETPAPQLLRVWLDFLLVWVKTLY